MRKLKLDLDDLRVETFAAGGREAQIGTVRGNMPFEMPATDDSELGGGSGSESGATCRKTCWVTCAIFECTDATCWATNYCCP
jgi:hypothetical protein